MHVISFSSSLSSSLLLFFTLGGGEGGIAWRLLLNELYEQNAASQKAISKNLNLSKAFNPIHL